MDIQLKRGLLDVCVLAAIKSEDSYGYQIMKDMKPYIELSETGWKKVFWRKMRFQPSDLLTKSLRKLWQTSLALNMQQKKETRNSV